MNPEHIKVEVTPGGVEVVVDDYELFDYVDDFIAERGLEYEYSGEREVQGKRHYTMHFGAGVSADRVAAVLNEIPPGEVDRIWSLNNE